MSLGWPPAEASTSGRRASMGAVRVWRTRWQAARCGGETAKMVKPSPVQGLAAIGAAASGQESASLEAAWTFHEIGELHGPLADLVATTVHIFEDTVGGMAAVRGAVELLHEAGVDIRWQPYGVTPATGAKAKAMAAQGIPTYRSVNAAVDVALSRV